MAKSASADVVLSHWYRLIEGLQTSSLDFYAAVEQALDHRHIPNSNRSRVDWKEAGAFSAKREYLRTTRARHGIDTCGAPFGNGFFVSWWLAEVRPHPVLPTIAVLVLGSFLFRLVSAFLGYGAGLFSLVTVFVVLGGMMSQNEEEWHANLLVVPLLGSLWERLFLPTTYYRLDTALMFQEAVHSAVQEVLDGLTKAQGLRALTEFERRPILREIR
jgi:hypothetical protein